MSDQMSQGVALLLVGAATLILSAGFAWTQARRSRAGRVQGAGIYTAVSFFLFLVGAIICWFGVTAVVEGQ